jgi:hypothetical protein
VYIEDPLDLHYNIKIMICSNYTEWMIKHTLPKKTTQTHHDSLLFKNVIPDAFTVNILSVTRNASDYATCWTTKDRFPAQAGTSLFVTALRLVPGATQPHIQRVPGVLSLEGKQPGQEDDHSPPSDAEVKNIPPYVFMMGYLIKHRNENCDLLSNSQSILNRWKNYFHQLLNVHGVNVLGKSKYITAESLVPEPRSFKA